MGNQRVGGLAAFALLLAAGCGAGGEDEFDRKRVVREHTSQKLHTAFFLATTDSAQTDTRRSYLATNLIAIPYEDGANLAASRFREGEPLYYHLAVTNISATDLSFTLPLHDPPLLRMELLQHGEVLAQFPDSPPGIYPLRISIPEPTEVKFPADFGFTIVYQMHRVEQGQETSLPAGHYTARSTFAAMVAPEAVTFTIPFEVSKK